MRTQFALRKWEICLNQWRDKRRDQICSGRNPAPGQLASCVTLHWVEIHNKCLLRSFRRRFVWWYQFHVWRRLWRRIEQVSKCLGPKWALKDIYVVIWISFKICGIMRRKGNGYRHNTEENETKRCREEGRNPKDLVPRWQIGTACGRDGCLYSRICKILNIRQ